jgi:hypothetical protein
MRTLIATFMEHHAGVVGPALTAGEPARDFQGFRDSGPSFESIFACDPGKTHMLYENRKLTEGLVTSNCRHKGKSSIFYPVH